MNRLIENRKEAELINDYNGRDYRTVWENPRALLESKFEDGIVKNLLSEQPGWFIDIGAGYGRQYPIYKKPGRKVILLDYALNLLELAAGKFSNDDNVYFIAANAYHLPFKNEVFNGGLSVRVFHHMNLPEKFMSEFGRVMRGGSEVVLEYANKRNLFRIFRRGRKCFEKNHEEYEPLHFGTHPNYFEKIAGESHFRVERTLGTGFFPRFLSKKGMRPLTPILSLAEKLFDSMFGRLKLCPLNFAKLKKIGADNASAFHDLKDVLRCPACGGQLDFSPKEMIRCSSCNRGFARNGKIMDFRYKPDSE